MIKDKPLWETNARMVICSFKNLQALRKKYPKREIQPSVYMLDGFVCVVNRPCKKVFTIKIEKVL